MAQKYTVKKQDNFLTLSKKFGVSPSKFMQKNGIRTLTPGQTISIPKPFGSGGGGVNYGSPQNSLQYVNPNGTYGFQTPTTGTGSGLISQTGFRTPAFGTGNVAGNYFQSPQTVTGAQGSLLAGGQPYKPAAQLGANSFVNAAGQVNNQAGMQQIVNGSVAGGTVAGGGATTARPAGVYTGGNDEASKAWRRYWNQQAGGTGDEKVYQMSKEDVWNMKAAQRRRTGGNGMPKPKAAPVVVTPQGNAVNTALSWRVG